MELLGYLLPAFALVILGALGSRNGYTLMWSVVILVGLLIGLRGLWQWERRPR